MKIKILAVGTKMPGWVQEGVKEYTKRLPRDFSLEIKEISPGNRSKSSSPARAIAQESELLLNALDPKDFVIALEVKGAPWSTEKLAKKLADWQMEGLHVVILIGGPDGLSAECRQRANQQWSLSALTLPHPVVRVVLAEQIYRAWTINQNHPYHRA